jgi:hypothetical protein
MDSMSPAEKPSDWVSSVACVLVGNPPPSPVDCRRLFAGPAKRALVGTRSWRTTRHGAFRWLTLKALAKKGKSPGD